MKNAELTFLGTGTSQGVPMIGCGCEVCQSRDPRDKRLRASALVKYCGMTILIDAGPDFRQQMLREGISHLDAILLTHNHKDHTGGLDDVRAFNYLEGLPAEIYCEKYVEESLRNEYSYAFAEKKYPGAPEWHIHLIDDKPFQIHPCDCRERLVWKSGNGYERIIEDHPANEGMRPVDVIPIRGMHYKLPVLGYRFGNIAYCTDMNFIPEKEFEKLHGLDHFVINCVKKGRHISHYSLEEAVEVARKVGARHSWLTHLSHQLPRFADLAEELPGGPEAMSMLETGASADALPEGSILPAFDGLRIGFAPTIAENQNK